MGLRSDGFVEIGEDGGELRFAGLDFGFGLQQLRFGAGDVRGGAVQILLRHGLAGAELAGVLQALSAGPGFRQGGFELRDFGARRARFASACTRCASSLRVSSRASTWPTLTGSLKST